MAVGPFMRVLAQIVVPVVAVLARALPAAYAQALQNARKAGVNAETVKQSFSKTMSKSEALQILNLSETEATAEAVQKQFDMYFAANDVKNGGSFYLQSKVYRAKELLDEFQREQRMENKQARDENNKADATSGPK